MGTRGFISFVVDGVEKASYVHWAHPDGTGLDVLRFLQAAQGEFGSMTELARKLRVVDNSMTPTPEDIEHLKPWTNLNVSEQSTADWYCLLRHTQGDPSAILKAGAVLDNRAFARDSLMCEYAYVVDLDRQVYEVYEGFQKEQPTAGRYKDLEALPDSDYFPVALWASWPLAELPSEKEFLAALVENDDE